MFRKLDWRILLGFILVVFFLVGCKPQQLNIAYFKNVPDSLYGVAMSAKVAAFKDPVIQSNDLLQITVLTLDKDDNEVLAAASKIPVNASITTNSQVASNTVSGFLVDREGVINLPAIGKVKVAGLTTALARDTIRNRMSRFYKSPVVNVRFANFTITVLGEVNKQGQYTVPNEKVSIIDAIGLAGDLTVDAKRENILLIRDSADVKQFTRFNLNSSSLLTSPYFYLHQGDVVYVEPKKTKPSGNDVVKSRNLAIITTAVSALATILTIVLTRN